MRNHIRNAGSARACGASATIVMPPQTIPQMAAHTRQATRKGRFPGVGFMRAQQPNLWITTVDKLVQPFRGS